MNNDDEQKPQPRKPLIQPRPRIKEEILVRRKKKARKPKKDSDEDYSAESNEDESIEDESKSDAGKNDNSNDADNELINESTHKSENNDIDDCSINNDLDNRSDNTITDDEKETSITKQKRTGDKDSNEDGEKEVNTKNKKRKNNNTKGKMKKKKENSTTDDDNRNETEIEESNKENNEDGENEVNTKNKKRKKNNTKGKMKRKKENTNTDDDNKNETEIESSNKENNKRKRDESENEGGEDIELEDQENIAITTSNDNPFILAWIDGVFNENYHERNDEYTTHNIIIITPNDWGGDRIPTEEMANDSFEEFRGLNPRFINYKAHTVEELLKYFWEFMSSLFMRVHKDGTAKFIGWHVTQLNTDLKRKFPKRRKISNNWRDTLNWQQTKEGALEDEIAWNCRQKPFDDKKKMAKVAQKFKEDLGVGYAQRNKKGWIEKTNGYSKRLTQKSLQDKRKNSHGKLVNSSSKNNVVAKKNKPEENTVFKRKKGQFHSTRFVHFLKPDGPGHFNDWILANGGTEKDKIEIEIIPSTKKPRPSMKMK